MRRIAIVPAFNEERNIGRLLSELRSLDPELEVVVVSDGSTDRTTELARAAGAHVVSLPFNLGIGGAVQTGFRYAWDGGYELAVRLDGDGQHDPAQLRELVAPVTGRRGRPGDRLPLPQQRAATAPLRPGASGSACSPASSRGSRTSASQTRPRASRR